MANQAEGDCDDCTELTKKIKSANSELLKLKATDKLKECGKWEAGEAKANDKVSKAKLKSATATKRLIDVSTVTMPLICKLLHDEVQKSDFKETAATSITGSFVKMGKAVYFPPDRLLKTVSEPVLKRSYFDSQTGWLHQHLLSSGHSQGAASIMRDGVLKNIGKLVGDNVDTCLMTRPPTAPADSWITDAFNLQFYMVLSGHGSIEPTPLCMNEVRIGLDGTCIFAGIDPELTPGTTWDDKVQGIANMKLDQFLSLAKASGFVVQMPPGSMLVIPQGMLVVTTRLDNEGHSKDLAKGTSSGLRWSFLPVEGQLNGDALPKHVASAIEAWPVLAQTEYRNLAEHLEDEHLADM